MWREGTPPHNADGHEYQSLPVGGVVQCEYNMQTLTFTVVEAIRLLVLGELITIL